MAPEAPNLQLTQLLRDWNGADSRAQKELADIVYRELLRLAQSYMRRERPDHTFQATALVHEAYLRLVDQRTECRSRVHFFGVAASMMRRILADRAKERRASKRGGGAGKVPFDEVLTISAEPQRDLVATNEALLQLEKVDPQRSRTVELRFFGGLSNEESAGVLGISTATVLRKWAGARAWLFHELSHQARA